MKRLLLSAVALFAVGSAHAADLGPEPASPLAEFTEWEVEFGARAWFSWGNVGAANPLLNTVSGFPPLLTSRLVYKDETAISGELFGRADHRSGLFVEGFAGLGRITDGKNFDEDFPADGAYSNTLGVNDTGELDYVTIDLGYNLLTAPGAKIGPIVGYNYFRQRIDDFGCKQLAGDTTCSRIDPGVPSFNYLTEDDTLQSIRFGLSGEFLLAPRLKLSADAAWLPIVEFSGQDNHHARGLIITKTANDGDGVQAEAVLSYAATDALSFGVGGRYWTWNLRDASNVFHFNDGTPPGREPARFNSERYGVFVQGSYRWGSVTHGAGGSKAPAVSAPNWSGLYVGGQLGAGFAGNADWSSLAVDRIGSTPGFPVATAEGALGNPTNFVRTTNVAGFGDRTDATGPLGGGQIGFNYQFGRMVAGLEADVSGADLRGENTCFSGLGGVNCQHVVNAIWTVTPRIGMTWARSLLYVKGGGAWANTTYRIDANTFFFSMQGFSGGKSSVDATSSGWTLGGGLEYALNPRWSAKVEYDFLSFDNNSVRFRQVLSGGLGAVDIRQEQQVVKLGVNYRVW